MIWVFKTHLVEDGEFHTHLPLAFYLFTITTLANQVKYLISLMKSASRRFFTSSFNHSSFLSHFVIPLNNGFETCSKIKTMVDDKEIYTRHV